MEASESLFHAFFTLAERVEIGCLALLVHVEHGLDEDGAIDGAVLVEVGKEGLVLGNHLLNSGITFFGLCNACELVELVGTVHQVRGHDGFVEIGPFNLDGTDAVVSTTHVA